MKFDNDGLTRFAIIVVIMFFIWMVFLIIKKLRGDAMMSKEDVYEILKQ